MKKMLKRDKEVLHKLTDSLDELADLIIEMVDEYDMKKAEHTMIQLRILCEDIKSFGGKGNGNDL